MSYSNLATKTMFCVFLKQSIKGGPPLQLPIVSGGTDVRGGNLYMPFMPLHRDKGLVNICAQFASFLLCH